MTHDRRFTSEEQEIFSDALLASTKRIAPMTHDEVERLIAELDQLIPESFDGVDVIGYRQVRDIIDCLRRLRDERDQARAALEPFADAWNAGGERDASPKPVDFRTAARVHAETGN